MKWANVYSSDSREVQVQAVQVQTRATQPIRFSKMLFFLDDFERLDKPEFDKPE